MENKRKAIIVDILEQFFTRLITAFNLAMYFQSIKDSNSIYTKSIFMPVAAAAAAADMSFSWWTASLNRFEAYPTARAVLNTFGFLALVAATVGTFAFSAAFGIAAPMIYVGVQLSKALFDAGAVIHLATKAAMTTEPVAKSEYKAQAVNAGLDSLVGFGIAGVVTCLTLFTGPVVSMAMGIACSAAWVLSLAWGYMRPFTTSAILKPEAAPAAAATAADSTVVAMKALDVTPAPAAENTTAAAQTPERAPAPTVAPAPAPVNAAAFASDVDHQTALRA